MSHETNGPGQPARRQPAAPSIGGRSNRRLAARLAAFVSACVWSVGAAHAQTAQVAGTWAASTDRTGVPASAQTARNIIRTSVGGTGVQLSLSNVFGDRDITFTSVTIGLQASGASLVRDSVSAVTFGGKTSVTIPMGQRVLSDVMPRTLAPQTKLAVSMYFPGATGLMTGHVFGFEDNFFSRQNVDSSADIDGSVFPYVGQFKVFVDAVYLRSANASGTVATLGDSITDGYDSGYGRDQRWPDRLADRLIAAGIPMGVMNAGIASNRVATDLAPGQGASSAVSRLDRDVLSIQGLTTVIVFEGINDLSAGAAAPPITAGLKSLVDRIHAAGKCVIGATVTPYGNANASIEAQRQLVNQYIRTSGIYDAVLDFDVALRDPANPSKLSPAFDSGDSLHPSPAGMQALANAVDLGSLTCAGLTNTNLSTGKTATQSTTDFGGVASRAVDGNVDGVYFDNSVTHTAGASQDWWQVDLGQVATLDSMRIWNRTDCCADRLSNFTVFAASTDMTGRPLAQLLADPTIKQVPVASLGAAARLDLPLGSARGRYVRIQLNGQSWLSLAEVQVFGRPSVNLAAGRLATQSSTDFGGVAGRAVDGVLRGNYFDNSVTHTGNFAPQDWWQVDLGKVATLGSVRLWNRTDCCSDRLSNFYVLVSSTDMTGRTLAQLRADPAVKQVLVASLNGNVNLELPMAGATGRYVRVQLAGQSWLSLGEVEVFGN